MAGYTLEDITKASAVSQATLRLMADHGLSNSQGILALSIAIHSLSCSITGRTDLTDEETVAGVHSVAASLTRMVTNATAH